MGRGFCMIFALIGIPFTLTVSFSIVRKLDVSYGLVEFTRNAECVAKLKCEKKKSIHRLSRIWDEDLRQPFQPWAKNYHRWRVSSVVHQAERKGKKMFCAFIFDILWLLANLFCVFLLMDFCIWTFYGFFVYSFCFIADLILYMKQYTEIWDTDRCHDYANRFIKQKTNQKIQIQLTKQHLTASHRWTKLIET